MSKKLPEITCNWNWVQFHHQVLPLNRILSERNSKAGLNLRWKKVKMTLFLENRYFLTHSGMGFLAIHDYSIKQPFFASMGTHMCRHCKLECPPPPRAAQLQFTHFVNINNARVRQSILLTTLDVEFINYCNAYHDILPLYITAQFKRCNVMWWLWIGIAVHQRII